MSKRRFVSLIVFLVLVCFQGQGIAQCDPTTDCNGNGVLDSCDLVLGTSDDCNNNLIPDECEISNLSSQDCNLNGIPDECEPVVATEMFSNNGAFGEQFGQSIATTEDIAVVGAPGDDVLGNNSGAVHVFRRVGTTWVDEIKLTASDPVPNDQFGSAVSINSDLVVIGAPDKASQTGAVYVFRRVGSNWWNLEAKLTAFDGTAGFRYGVAVASSNGRVFVGAPMSGTISGSGAIYIYHQVGGSWLLEAKITPQDATAGDDFGASIASSGNLVAVGAPGAEVNQVARAGKAIIYQGLSGLWFQQGVLFPANAQQNGQFAASIAIGSGALAVGAPGEDGDDGAAYIYEQGGSTWILDQRLTPVIVDGNDTFGLSVALGSGTAAIGAPGSDGGNGRVFTYRFTDGSWIFNSTLLPINPIAGSDVYGSSVGAAGAFAMIGASGAQTAYAHWIGTPADCNANFVEDVCDITSGTSEDCNLNQIPDECELANGSKSDCNFNGIPDECELAEGNLQDCNLNNVPDSCDLSDGTSLDCNLNGIPDGCEVDCNNNGIPDDCDLETGFAGDCNGNLIPDICDVTLGLSSDCNSNSIPDECDLSSASSIDCDQNGNPDECDIAQGTSQDCNINGTPDGCDLSSASSQDCNVNAVPDECDIDSGISNDCDSDSNPDECELIASTGFDCNSNGLLDNCDIATGGSNDCNLNSVPDDCEIDADSIPPVINNLPAPIASNSDLGVCGAIVTWDDPTASDDCGISTFTSNHPPGSLFGVGTTTVEYTAVDVSGNLSTAAFQVTVNDSEGPTLSGISVDITVNANPGQCDALVSWIAPVPEDNCEVISVSSSHSPGSLFEVGTTTVSYSVVDISGNSHSVSFDVIVNDVELPVIGALPGDIIAENEAGSCSVSVTWSDPSATDNCAILLLSPDFQSGSNFPVGDTVVTYTAIDLSGNSTSDTFTVTVVDQDLPLLVDFPVDIEIPVDGGSCLGTASWIPPTATDNCGVAEITSSHLPGETFQIGTTSVSYSATDIHGNTATSTFSVIVNELEAPTLVDIPGPITVSSDTGLCTGVATWIEPTGNDNCGIALITSDHQSGDSFPVGTSVVTFTATDSVGNQSTAAVEIVVTDTQAPAISNIPADITESAASGLCTALVNWIEPTASDNCSISSLTSDLLSGSIFPVGITTVTYTAIDSSGLSVEQSLNVTVLDDQVPTIIGLPVQINLLTEPSLCSAVATWTLPTYEDNCQVDTNTSSHLPGDSFDVGITTVTYQVTDVNGNNSSESFDVIVLDDQLPEIVGELPDVQLSNDAGLCEAIATWIVPTVTDNCGSPILTSSHEPGDSFLVGSSLVIYTAVDQNGQQSQRQFTVTVTDDEIPVISGLSTDITVDSSTDQCGTIVSWLPPGSTDNCVFLSLTSGHLPGGFFPVGVTEVVYTATDFNGNSTAASFLVTVNDIQPPTLSGVPASITTVAEAGLCNATVTWNEPIADDNCSIASLIPSHSSGSQFPVGTTTITYVATDSSGLTSEQAFTVEVIDDQPPVIAGLPAQVVVPTQLDWCGSSVAWQEPSGTDNCSLVSLTSDVPNGSFFNLGSNEVIYTALDSNQNVTTFTMTLIVEDNEVPQIIGTPADLVLTSAPGTCGAIASWVEPTATDNCTLSNFLGSHLPSSLFLVGETTVTYTATDGTGNTNATSFVVTVSDNEVPQITGMPENMIQNSDPGDCGSLVSWIEPQAQDNCSVISLTTNIPSGSFLAVGSHEVAYTATDVNGNVAIASFAVEILDNENPLIIGDLPNITVGNDPGLCTSIVHWIEPTASDNCSVLSLDTNIPSGTTFNIGTTTVTYTTLDIHGNSSVLQFDVTVEDVQIPEILNLPAAITLTTEPGSCEATASWAQPTTQDNCAVLSFNGSHVSGSSFQIGTTTISYTAVDSSGNSTVESFSVTVVDQENPIFVDLPSNFSAGNEPGICGAIIDWTEPSSIDNCGTVSVTASHQSGTFFPVGLTEVHYTSIDNSGNSVVGSFTVTVTDEEFPSLTGIPTDVTIFSDPGQCFAIHTWIDPVATDNCTVQVFDVTQGPGSSFQVGSTSVIYTLIDQTGNTVTSSFVVTVLDNQTPEIIGTPASISVLSEAGLCTAQATWIPASATDNCSLGTFTSSHLSGETFPLGSTLVTYTATDVAGNTTETTFTVNVIDDQAPVISGLPSTISVASDPGMCGTIVTWIEPTASDNCVLSEFTSNIANGSFFEVGSATISYTAIDSSGNSSAQSFLVAVLDQEIPVITGLPGDLVLSTESGTCGASVTWIEAQPEDNCGIVTFGSDVQIGAFFEVGTTQVSYEAIDVHGNQTTAGFTVTIIDDELPSMVGMPADLIVNNDAGFCSAVVTWIEPSAADNCDTSTIQTDFAPGSTFAVGTTPVSYTATDSSGNIQTSSFNVTVLDSQTPDFVNLPGDLIVETELNVCGANVAWDPAIASDNCEMGTLTPSHPIGSFFPLGDTIVTYTATDAAGNEQIATFIVHVLDSQLPALVNTPASFTLQVNPGECGATVTWNDPVAVDNCQIVSATSNHTSGSFLPVGDSLVIYTALDSSGNEYSEEFTVTVVDDEAPTLVGMPGDLIDVADPGQCSSVITWTEPAVSDNCSVLSLTSSHSSGAIFDVGNTVVSYTSTDINGNQNVGSFTVTVQDTESPVFSGLPSSIEMTNDPGECGAIATWIEPTAADNCSMASLDSSLVNGSLFQTGISTVVYTATDASGNTSIASFSVTVVDDELPVISEMPVNLLLSNDPGVCGAAGNWIAPSATDNCVLLSFSSNFQLGEIFPIGTTLVTYTATDNAGHSTTSTFNVTVVDDEAPLIFDAPADLIVQSDAGECGALVSWQSPLTSDNCQVVDFGTVSANGGFYPVGTTSITYTSTDSNGNSALASFNVTVEDHETPAISGLPLEVVINSEFGTCQAQASWQEPVASDNCQVASIVSDQISGSIFSIGDTEVTYTATDIHGNEATSSFTVSVHDSEIPVAVGVPEDITVLADVGGCSAIATWVEPTVSDNCTAIGISSDITSGSIFTVGTTVVTYTAEDLAGNTSSSSFSVIVIDDQSPQVVNLPMSIELALPAQGCEAIVSWIEPEALDNCGIQSLISSLSPGTSFPQGTTTILYTATDFSGNESYGTFQVTLIDVSNPVIGGLPEPIVTQTDPGQCGASVFWIDPTVFDNCTVLTFESSHTPGSFLPVGNTMVSYTASDAAGNTAIASFTITVTDLENPVVVSSGAITVDAEPGSCTAFVTVPPPVTMDNCSVVSLINDFNGTSEASGIYPMDTSLLLWTVTDGSGNIATTTQAITVSVPQIDCNLNGNPDTCDIAIGTSLDCNVDGIPDECQEDCNGNGIPDDCDLAAGALPDCNSNGIPDSCDIASGLLQDCDQSQTPDECEVSAGHLADCNLNGLPDICEIATGAVSDCNGNSIPDSCDLSSGVSVDCNLNSIPDSCDLVTGMAQDCNVNGVPDLCDFVNGAAIDCNGNMLPDVCEIATGSEPDCNGNGYLDSCEIQQGMLSDCNGNLVPDGCDLSSGSSPDCNGNLVPDECDIATGQIADCNNNGLPDICDLANGTVSDCDGSGIPDMCEVSTGQVPDCDLNGIPDSCDIASGLLVDCNSNGVPDSCDLASGLLQDCDLSGTPDVCEISSGQLVDCNLNGLPDNCEINAGTAADCNSNSIPDVCDLSSGSAIDCDLNNIPDTCDLASGFALDCNVNGVPDHCDLVSGFAIDCNGNLLPDLCEIANGSEPDCNGNDFLDVCEVQQGIVADCNGNLIPDTCDLSGGFSPDCNSNLVPDECDIATGQIADCNGNGIPDGCDLANGTVSDCDGSGIPDMCEVATGQTPDCDSNGVPDSCDIASGLLVDCNSNGVPDSCDLTSGLLQDCDLSGTPDVCEISSGQLVDCNLNGLPDNCEINAGTAADCNSNSIPDVCDLSSGSAIDCDLNNIPDTCDLASGFALDCNVNGVPDHCDLVSGFAIDCNGNLLPDLCEIANGSEPDCNGNDFLDVCEVQQGIVADCNGNLIPDTCDLSGGFSPDCNSNLVPDECDIATGQIADCNGNGIPDGCDLANGTVSDCDGSGIPDMCEVATGQTPDCDSNGVPDSCDIASGIAVDCNLTGIPDSCELALGQVPDCNGNNVPDSCDIANGSVPDCDFSGIPDICEVASGQVSDCNSNGVPDDCDVASGSVPDCDSSGIPDSCEVATGQVADCNANGVPDNCDLAAGTEPDCDSSGIPDSCEVASGQAADCDGNGTPDNCDIASGLVPDCDQSGIPDSCEVTTGQTPDCNGNGIPDVCDISSGSVADCDGSGIPDTCEVASGQAADCNNNGIPDSCDITSGAAGDCNNTGIPDSCEVQNGTVPDCNANSLPDSCDIASGIALDCDTDGIPDSCEIAQGSESDCNADGFPDLCQIISGELADCNGNLVPDECDLAAGTSEDVDANGQLDECQVQFHRGDANSDSIVNIADGIFLLQNLFGGGPESICQDAADANDDGGIDVSDVIFVLSFQFGGGAAPPAPFGQCGVDPTYLDGLDCVSYGSCP